MAEAGLVEDVSDTTPILVGVAAVSQKCADFRDAVEPTKLMENALRAAADDAGSAALLSRADEIYVPKSLWGYSDPGRLVADAVGAISASTVLADFGILQQGLLTRACERIASGEACIVLVSGGETRFRELCAGKAGETAAETAQTDAVADVVLTPEAEIWSSVESDSGLGMPVGYYAILDSALRAKQGLSVDEHRDHMASMYAQMSEIAAGNPDAWSDEPVDAAFIRDASSANRMLAFPYTKLHNSQWNVDQAAGLIFCSAGVARELGIARNQWIFPRAAAESNFMSVVASRKDLGGSPAFRIAGETVMDMAGVSPHDVAYRELYSCFPYALRVQMAELGLSPADPFSVTGGMTFAGGPLNNFVFQATVKMAQCLRADPGAVGLVTTVSGMLTKQACALWSASPGQSEWACADVTREVAAASPACELVGDYSGEGSVAGYTVLYQGAEPWRAVAVFDIPQERRTVAYSEDPQLIARMLNEECCRARFSVASGQFSEMSVPH